MLPVLHAELGVVGRGQLGEQMPLECLMLISDLLKAVGTQAERRGLLRGQDSPAAGYVLLGGLKDDPEEAVRGHPVSRREAVDFITRTSHYESFTMRGTGYNARA
jgi:hypothetical protein